jgi:hypothetical protein
MCASSEPRRVAVEDGHSSACWVFAGAPCADG